MQELNLPGAGQSRVPKPLGEPPLYVSIVPQPGARVKPLNCKHFVTKLTIPTGGMMAWGGFDPKLDLRGPGRGPLKMTAGVRAQVSLSTIMKYYYK